MEIMHEETGSHGRYSTSVEGHTGEMTYSRTSPQLIIVDHTLVPDALRGKGVGQALAKHAIEEALRLVPMAGAVLAWHPGHGSRQPRELSFGIPMLQDDRAYEQPGSREPIAPARTGAIPITVSDAFA